MGAIGLEECIYEGEGKSTGTGKGKVRGGDDGKSGASDSAVDWGTGSTLMLMLMLKLNIYVRNIKERKNGGYTHSFTAEWGCLDD